MKTGAQHLYLNNNEDDNILDERGVIRNGKTYRVPTYMMDSAQIAAAANRSHAFGLDDASDADGFTIERNTSEREKLYADAETRLKTAYLDPYAAWRDPAPVIVPGPKQTTNDEQAKPATLEDSYALYHDRLVNGWRNPPAMAPIVPDSTPRSLLPLPSASMTDERDKTYQEYNERISRQWEKPL